MKVEQMLNQAITGKKEVDFYCPVTIEFEENDNKDKELFYYRLLNQKSSFVEMSINSVTEKVVYITLVSVNDVVEMSNEIKDLDCPREIGNPMIDMRIFENEHVVTDKVSFSIMRDEKKIYVVINSVEVHKSVSLGDVDLLLDNQDNIVGFVFKGFTDLEWQEMNESIDRSVNVALEAQTM